ncbi:hypothetical protein B0H14DRAFT_2576767 [Mycena olivaceomarginata]|nr:hypothetical protein B0H14DRAFT_2576767 [Mycena olivaceomarginata]
MPPRQKKTTEAEAAAPAPSQTPKRSRRARRAPTAPDQTPPPPPTPPPHRRQRRQPAPPTELDPAPPAEAEGPPVGLDPVGTDAALPRTRDIFDNDSEGGAVGVLPCAGVHFNGFHDDDGEEFPEPSSTSSRSRSPSPTREPASHRRRQRGSPRAGPHASPVPVPRQRRTDRSQGASDVWTFFNPKELEGAQKRECLFCRQQHATDTHIGTTKFAKSTSTGVLRKHLYEHHIDVWVEGCDQLKIPIKAKEAAKFVDAYRVRKHQKTGNTSNSEPGKRKSFSQEVFVDTIVEFIVGDD